MSSTVESIGRMSLASLALAILSISSSHADGLQATAEIKGCTNPAISGTATLVEQVTPEGVKEVTVEMKVKGLTDGKHAVHIHEVAACEPCGCGRGPLRSRSVRPVAAGQRRPTRCRPRTSIIPTTWAT